MRGIVDGEYQDGRIRGLLFAVGMRNMGKTTLMDQLLGECAGGVILFDTLSKHAEKFPDYRVTTTISELEQYLRLNRGRRFHILHQPRRGNLDKIFRKVCLLVTLFGPMIFAIDEIDKLCGARWGDFRMPPELYHLVNYGRHEQVSMIATARNPKAVARGYTAESEIFAFRVEEKSYREYLIDRMGEDAAEQLASLPRFTYLHKVEDAPIERCGGPQSGIR